MNDGVAVKPIVKVFAFSGVQSLVSAEFDRALTGDALRDGIGRSPVAELRRRHAGPLALSEGRRRGDEIVVRIQSRCAGIDGHQARVGDRIRRVKLSRMLAARIAKSYDARKRMSDVGDQARPALKVVGLCPFE